MRLCWFDIETTGLDPEKDLILEVAAIVTGADVERTIGSFTIPIKQDLSVACGLMNPFVTEMHSRNGLLSDIARGYCSPLAIAEAALTDLLNISQGSDPGPIYLAGNSIHFDRSFVKRHMPALEGKLYYRMLDVSSLKIACRDVLGIAQDKGAGAHRAMADVVESIKEFQFFAARVQK